MTDQQTTGTDERSSQNVDAVPSMEKPDAQEKQNNKGGEIVSADSSNTDESLTWTQRFSKWSIVFGSFMVHFVVLGSQYSFGVLFSALVDDLGSDEGATAWVGSVSTALMLGGGIVTGPLAKRYGCRTVAFIGGLTVALGLVLSTYTTSLWHLYISYGLTVGIGYALSFVCSVIIVQQHFVKNRSFATGIAASGSGVGTFVYAPVTEALIQEFGWRPTLRILAIFAIVGISCNALLFKKPPASLYGSNASSEKQTNAVSDNEENPLPYENGGKETGKPNVDEVKDGKDTDSGIASVPTSVDQPKETRKEEVLRLLRNPALRRLVILASIMGGPYFVPMVHLERYASKELDFQSQQAALVISILGIASTLGRLGVGAVTNISLRVRVYTFILGLLFTTGMTALMPASRDVISLNIVTFIFGFFAGSFIATMPVVTADTVGPKDLPMAMGFMYGFQALSVAIGPPIAGWIFVATGSYNLPLALAGTVGFAATIVLLYPLYPYIVELKETKNTEGKEDVESASASEENIEIENQ